MRKYLILCGLAVLALLCVLSVHSQAPALDDLGNALVNHGQDPATAGPTAAIIEVMIANNNALLARISTDETNANSTNNSVTALQALEATDNTNIGSLQTAATAVQNAEAADSSNISTLQSQTAALQASQTAAQASLTSVQTAEATDAQNIQGLQGQVATLQPSTISALQAQVAALQAQLAQLLVTAPTSPLTILQQPTNQTVVLANGTVATFPMQFSSGGCHVEAIGQKVYGPTGDGTGNYTFKVTGVTAAMNGTSYQFQVYNCNQAGTVNTNTVTLTVQ